jgi:hypothetical protein
MRAAALGAVAKANAEHLLKRNARDTNSAIGLHCPAGRARSSKRKQSITQISKKCAPVWSVEWRDETFNYTVSSQPQVSLHVDLASRYHGNPNNPIEGT